MLEISIVLKPGFDDELTGPAFPFDARLPARKHGLNRL